MINAFITVRSKSSRLPEKCFLPFGDMTMIEHIIIRAKDYNLRPIVCTTTSKEDIDIVKISDKHGVDCFMGSEINKLKRWKDCCLEFNIDKFHSVDADDPLEAGLEMMVSPPGKKLQSMSLLSGGEQALTAMSLIFAVFLTNPSPICVLDEVDAPLDDANVERFCNLLDDIAEKTNTKFLIITHHALTMSRMDRLFGVTMAERGVSQIVSVDLKKAEEIGAVA